MTSQKSINPNQILSIKASYEDMSGMIADSADFFDSDDASKDKVASTTSRLKSVSQEIVSTVEQLDGYLNTVAEAFRQADQSIANSIEESLVNGKELRKRDITKSSSYQMLP
ncbi:hypothetical protein JO388_01080 [Streptococcus suis]|uniref:TIGR04197 family type VII secretion effector n=2 Tax=Streptococcus suis TaxID=1307 RepID=A0A0Z8LED7_STRSU|nr:hypothetical protein [Streptococcus suis]MBM7178874.1 hypothetical protein [Streptococcus suis]CYV88965.1 Uncharacterised protein [Streptococcus suis]HEL1633270.1 hypothetical protein [Streptococcus suis]HEL2651937.1 hypothetical protein [Streptococcus suis]